VADRARVALLLALALCAAPGVAHAVTFSMSEHADDFDFTHTGAAFGASTSLLGGSYAATASVEVTIGANHFILGTRTLDGAASFGMQAAGLNYVTRPTSTSTGGTLVNGHTIPKGQRYGAWLVIQSHVLGITSPLVGGWDAFDSPGLVGYYNAGLSAASAVWTASTATQTWYGGGHAKKWVGSQQRFTTWNTSQGSVSPWYTNRNRIERVFLAVWVPKPNDANRILVKEYEYARGISSSDGAISNYGTADVYLADGASVDPSVSFSGVRGYQFFRVNDQNNGTTTLVGDDLPLTGSFLVQSTIAVGSSIDTDTVQALYDDFGSHLASLTETSTPFLSVTVDSPAAVNEDLGFFGDDLPGWLGDFGDWVDTNLLVPVTGWMGDLGNFLWILDDLESWFS